MPTPFLEVAKTRYLLADGGISVMLRRLAGGDDGPVESWNLTRPELVTDLHRQFLESGAQCLTTNSFGANALHATGFSAEDCRQMARRSVELARAAAASHSDHVYLLGSAGPWHGAAGAAWETAWADQVTALCGAGVDALCIETLTSLAQARALVSAAKSSSGAVPVIASFAFQKKGSEDFVLPGDGTPLATVARELATLGADGYGLNCGAGTDGFDYSTLISAFREATGTIVVARPSAGDPLAPGDPMTDYRDSPEYLAEAVWGMVRSGANVIGGCCGVTPEHIAAFRQELDMLG